MEYSKKEKKIDMRIINIAELLNGEIC